MRNPRDAACPNARQLSASAGPPWYCEGANPSSRRKEAPVNPTTDPLPFLRGLSPLPPAARLAFILRRTGRQSRRTRRLPAEATARLGVALGLFADLPVPQVWRRLHPGTDAADPVDSAFTQARSRL